VEWISHLIFIMLKAFNVRVNAFATKILIRSSGGSPQTLMPLNSLFELFSLLHNVLLMCFLLTVKQVLSFRIHILMYTHQQIFFTFAATHIRIHLLLDFCYRRRRCVRDIERGRASQNCKH